MNTIILLRRSLLGLGLYFLVFSFATAQIHYVSPDGTGDGSSWGNASSDLKQILESAQNGEQVWVAAGSYRTSSCADCGTAEKELAFSLNEGVSLYGGFSGSETSLSQRNPTANMTILEGDLGDQGDDGDNSYTILQIGVVSNAIVDGITFQNGNANQGVADEAGPLNSGGAIHIMTTGAGNVSSPTISNCIFKNNRADSFGGAIQVYAGFDGHGNVDIINCTFQGNFAPKKGGAIFEYGSFNGTLEGQITNCTFTQNAATEGGAMYVLGSKGAAVNLDISNCLFEYNWSVSEGGAILNYATEGTNYSTYTNCTFYNNSGERGGAIYNNGSFDGICSPNYINCIFKANTADNGGAGIYNNVFNDGLCESVFSNCTFESNYTEQSGGGLFNNGSDGGRCVPVFERCYFLENIVEMYGGGMYNLGKSGESSPIIVNCLFRRNKGTAAGGIYNFGGSNGQSNPIVQNCTFTLNEANVGPCIYNQGSDPTGTVEPFVSNCIFWDNEAYSGFGLVFQNGHANPTIQYSLIPYDDCTLLNTDPTSTLNCGDGLIFNEDPLFTDESNLNFRPLPGSPIVDMGTTNNMTSMDLDLDGYPRIYNSLLDLGAYEYGQNNMPMIITQSNSETYCPGDSITLEVNASGVGTLTYQWQKDGTNISGANNSLFILAELTAGDIGVYTCQVTGAGNSVMSDQITIAMHEPNATTIDLDPTAMEFCPGENEIIITAQIENGGYFPSISWLYNDQEVSTDFAPLALSVTDGDELKVVYNALQLCFSDDDIESETIVFTEQSIVTPAISIELSGSAFCDDDNIIVNADTENGGDNPSYQWFVNGNLQSEDSAEFTSMDLENNDVISAQLTSSLSCVSNSMAASNQETVTIAATTFPSIAIEDNNDSLCINQGLTFTAIIEEAGSAPGLQWIVDGVVQMSTEDLLEYTFTSVGEHSVTANVISSDPCPNESVVGDQYVFNTMVCTTSTTADIWQNELKVWPNPATETVHLSWSTPIGKVHHFRLRTADGRALSVAQQDAKWHSKGVKLDVDLLNSGCFFLEIFTEKGHLSTPIIISK